METSARRSPVSVASAAFLAHASQDWPSVASLVDEESLRSFRDQQLLMARAMAAHSSVVQPEANPHIAPAVIDFFNSMSQLHQDTGLQGFPRIQSVAELEELSARELLARYLEGQAPNPDNYDDGRPPVTRRTVIGAVRETETLAHVVYRITTDAGQYGMTEQIDVLSCSARDGAWSISLNDDLSAIGSMRVIRTESSEP